MTSTTHVYHCPETGEGLLRQYQAGAIVVTRGALDLRFEHVAALPAVEIPEPWEWLRVGLRR